MIKYTISCPNDHVFDVWFSSGASCDDQLARGLVECPTCGSVDTSKALMAPRVNAGSRKEEAAQPASAPPSPTPGAQAVTGPRAVMEKLWALRAEIERSTENVGPRFAEEARRIHDGEAEDRAIWGACTPDDAQSLIEDDIPVAPMPPARRDD